MSYKDDQRETRAALKPRILEQHWGKNRHQNRSRHPVRLTGKDSKHVVADYSYQREDDKLPPGPTNHQRMLIRKERRDSL